VEKIGEHCSQEMLKTGAGNKFSNYYKSQYKIIYKSLPLPSAQPDL
jgi:hypothetical protein